MVYQSKLRRLRRMVNAAEQRLEISAPICPDARPRDEPVEPLGEQEFEAQMKIGFFRPGARSGAA